MSIKCFGTSIGALCENYFGEPVKGRLHPLSFFGKIMKLIEKITYKPTIKRSLLFSAEGVVLLLLPLLTLYHYAYRFFGFKGLKVTRALILPFVLWFSLGGNQLRRIGEEIARRLEDGDIKGAKELLPSLVGRDVANLDEVGISKATIESLSENLVDSVVAPMFWSLALGPEAVVVHRAINTLDAMVGKRDDRYEIFGKVSAICDDVLAFIPARLTPLLVSIIRPSKAVGVVKSVISTSKGHPSPNSGIAESAFAGALEVGLGGEISYGGISQNRPELGFGGEPGPQDIFKASKIVKDVGLLLSGLCLFGPPIVFIFRKLLSWRRS